MDQLYKYVARISDGSGITSEKNEFDVSVVNIIGENEQRMVVDDLHFTRIEKRAKGDRYQGYETYIGKSRIIIYAEDMVWGNHITYVLFSTKKKKAATIRKEIQRRIDEKFSFLNGKIDLSGIREPNNPYR